MAIGGQRAAGDQCRGQGGKPGHQGGGSAQQPPAHPADPSRTPLLILSVQDRGPGIPASEHQKIFERFYRRGDELRRETQGVGIGLSIVKHIVEAHGGRVMVRSGAGKGSKFIVELPLTTTDQHR